MDKKRSKNGVRLAKKEDIKQIQELGGEFRFMKQQEIIDAINKRIIFVYEKDGKVVGFILYNNKRNCIHDLIVHPDYRRQGIGTELFRVTTSILNIHYLEIWATLEPNNSIPFWKKMRFQEIPIIKTTKGKRKLKKMIWVK